MPVHEPTRSFDDSIIHKSSIMIQSPAGENLENLKCVQHLHSREPIDDRIYKTRVLYKYSHTLVLDPYVKPLNTSMLVSFYDYKYVPDIVEIIDKGATK